MNKVCEYCKKECKNKSNDCDNFDFDTDIIKVDENFKDYKLAVRSK